ncbi:MAG TPA: PEP-CTERM sorting domain-containing protein [Candidatus Solibacter sp.]|nr:PEP-CTERM sorting domain-containing protein [Candidatus Solibacter sp.]
MGWGPNNNYAYGSTGLSASITSGVPEPGTLLLMGAGLVLAGVCKRRTAPK